jgi:hypothetical protein
MISAVEKLWESVAKRVEGQRLEIPRGGDVVEPLPGPPGTTILETKQVSLVRNLIEASLVASLVGIEYEMKDAHLDSANFPTQATGPAYWQVTGQATETPRTAVCQASHSAMSSTPPTETRSNRHSWWQHQGPTSKLCRESLRFSRGEASEAQSNMHMPQLSLNQIVPILSLVIAGLAVFVGPFVTLRLGRKQIELSRRIASRQIVAPMRQAWINSFREKLAEFTGSASHYWNMRQVMVGTLQLTDDEQRKLCQLEDDIELFINPNETDHTELLEALGRVRYLLERGEDPTGQFNDDLRKAKSLGQKIFKTEWDRIKADIERP